MSITSRSQSSSPDVLGPPGDAEYLISSPIKPFAGRQSFFSPAIIRRQQTPAKRPRLGRSPSKSAHSIRFDDVLLPGSPAMNSNSRQRSISPEKILQPDGNVSPWRIRVTLEATQDEENQDTPSRKRLRPSTVTTMVPLKDGSSPLKENTPTKRRGRPRKSAIQAQNESPFPGSPGNTPGLRDTPLRKRGRPRKGTPKPQAMDFIMAEDEPTPAPEINFSPMDLTADNNNVGRQWSPINFAADGGSDSDSVEADELPLTNLRPSTPSRESWTNNSGREYGRTSLDTPVINPFEDIDERLNSTPSKMPSPTRERQALSSRSSRLVSNTSSPHTYPTPTPTSSPIEEELQAIDDHEDPAVAYDDDNFEQDPTGDHEEFDSIMESEGFTMISLDTLPSARQHGLGSGARTATDNPAKILQDRQNGRIGERLKRKLPGIDDLAHGQRRRTSTGLFYPEIFASGSPKPSIQTIEKVPEADEEEEKVEEIVHTRSNQHEQEASPQPSTLASIRARQESEWELERQTVSRHAEASMSAGSAIYINSDGNDQSEDEEREEYQKGDDQQEGGQPEEYLSEEDQQEAPAFQFDSEYDENHPPEEYLPVDDQQEEDQQEELAFPYDSEYDEYVDGSPPSKPEPEPEPELELGPEEISTAQQEEKKEEDIVADSEDDFGDIWQQEARDNSYISHHSNDQQDEDLQEEDQQREEQEPEIFADNEADDLDDIWQPEAPHNSYISQYTNNQPESSPEKASPWRQIGVISSNQDHQSSSPVYVTMEHSNEPWVEPTRIRKMRDQDVDLSALLAQEETPNRARYFSGTSTPRNVLNHGSHNSALHNADRRTRLQPISPSPERDPPAATQHIPLQNEDYNSSASESGLPKMDSVRESSSATTPEPRMSKDGTVTSSWFKKITSFTPRWLKAPAQSRYDNSSVIYEEEQVESDEKLGDMEPAAPSIQSQTLYPVLPRVDEEHESSADASSDEVLPLEHDTVENSFFQEEIEELINEEPFNVKSVSKKGVTDVDVDVAVSLLEDNDYKKEQLRPLPTSGYFSDAHYVALRDIYRMAKRHPERVQYFDTPSRDEIIGDWIWASDRRHAVPITEVQFSVIDRFTDELSRADMQNGGSGNIEWTEADLHRRLISIIIGEQIREEQKVDALR